MAILRSVDGKFYEISDDRLKDLEISLDKVKEVVASADTDLPAPPRTKPDGDASPKRN